MRGGQRLTGFTKNQKSLPVVPSRYGFRQFGKTGHWMNAECLPHIGAIAEVRAIVESLLQPNANVSPQYESYSITLKDAEPKVVFELSERGGNHQYIDLAGNILDVKIEDLVKRERLPVSIMPEGLVMRLTDAEVRDLVVFLASQ